MEYSININIVGHGTFITFAATTKWQQETVIKKKSQMKISPVKEKWKILKILQLMLAVFNDIKNFLIKKILTVNKYLWSNIFGEQSGF